MPSRCSVSRTRAPGVELAELALSLERLELAQDYFERALDEEPDNARALAGLARTRGDRFELTEPLARRALEEAPADAQVLASVADFYARGARREALDTSERQHRLEQARRLFTRSLQLERDAVAAQLGLARTYLAEGDDVTLGIRWAKAAQQLRPGSLEIDLVLARLEAKQGWLSSARLRTIDMISRTHSIRLRRLGRELVEAIAEMGSR